MSSSGLMDGMASIGKIDSKIHLIIASIVAVILSIVALYLIFKKDKVKMGVMMLAICFIVVAVAYYNNYLVSTNPVYAAMQGTNDTLQALTGNFGNTNIVL